ncbi:MAG: hypothetical protein Q8P90_00670 [bacterium]|nr:hypothetical protein [bacterium]
MKKLLSILFSLVVAIFAIPAVANAGTAELVNINPTATDLSQYGGTSDVPAGTHLDVFGGVIGTQYTAVYTVDAEPAMVVLVGAEELQPWVYDANAGTLTVYVDFTGFAEGIEFGAPSANLDFDIPEIPTSPDPFSIAVVWPDDAGNGLPSEMIGTTMATNTDTWNIIPPDENDANFGFELSGPAGSTVNFYMFIPQAVIDLLSSYSDTTLNIEDLAVSLNDEQATLAVTENTERGGADVDISVLMSETKTVISSLSASTAATSITVARKKPVSIAATKGTIKKGKYTKIFGWIRSGKKDKRVTLWKKVKGTDTFVKFKSLRTNKKGKYSHRMKPGKTQVIKAKFKTKVAKKKITVN